MICLPLCLCKDKLTIVPAWEIHDMLPKIYPTIYCWDGHSRAFTAMPFVFLETCSRKIGLADLALAGIRVQCFNSRTGQKKTESLSSKVASVEEKDRKSCLLLHFLVKYWQTLTFLLCQFLRAFMQWKAKAISTAKAVFWELLVCCHTFHMSEFQNKSSYSSLQYNSNLLLECEMLWKVMERTF